MMGLSEKFLKAEIEKSKTVIEQLKQGIEVNKIVQKAFEYKAILLFLNLFHEGDVSKYGYTLTGGVVCLVILCRGSAIREICTTRGSAVQPGSNCRGTVK